MPPKTRAQSRDEKSSGLEQTSQDRPSVIFQHDPRAGMIYILFILRKDKVGSPYKMPLAYYFPIVSQSRNGMESRKKFV